MKVSYKVLKKYIPHIASPEDIAQDLIMHTAEVESIEKIGKHLESVYIGKIISAEQHPDADKLNICQVDVCGETRQIICGAPNVKAGLIVCAALPGAELKPGCIIEKSKIRGEVSNGMLCSEDELGLVEERQDGIMELPEDAPLGVCAREYFGFDDVILEIDNKAINHRPDLFSHIGVAREIEAIRGNKLPYDMSDTDFSHLPDLGITNDIPHIVKRYMGLKVQHVANIPSPDYLKDVLLSHDIESKGLLVDITNYSLYLYGQPTHCFDADKISGNIHIRFAKDGENFTGLNGKSYELTSHDIVIADAVSVLALGGVIGGAASAVSATTKNIIIESAWFDHAVVRQTGKRHGLRTDSLNVFEKDLVCAIRHTGPSLIIKELMDHCPEMVLESFTDIYPQALEQTTIPYSLERINALIGASYSDEQVQKILHSIGVEKIENIMHIPLWRKDLSHIADIAEEVARLDGFEKVQKTIPRVTLGAVTQSPSYLAKRSIRNHLTSQGFFEMYTYSFTNPSLQEKAGSNIDNCPEMKNYLSEELSHLRDDLVIKLLEACEDNSRDFFAMKLFEIEKVFEKNDAGIQEHYELAGLICEKSENLFYSTQDILNDIFHTIGVQKFGYQSPNTTPSYAHSGRTASVVVRGKEIGYIGEISPKVRSNFSLGNRVAFFKINLDALLPAAFSLVSAKEFSQYQENNFDITFVVDLKTPGRNIISAIEKTSPLITKVSLFDVYTSEEKLPGQRALSFTVYFGSLTHTLGDDVKNKLIEEIVAKVEKVGGKLR